MEKGLDFILHLTDNILSKRGINAIDVVEIHLVLITWKFLTDKVNPKHCAYHSSLELNNPGEKYYFDNFYKSFGEENSIDNFQDVLKQWETSNKEVLQGLISVERVKNQNLDNKTFKEVYLLSYDYLEQIDYQERWSKKNVESLFDSIRAYLIKQGAADYQYSVPKEITALMVKGMSDMTGGSLYDPCSRTGEFLATAASKYPGIKQVVSEVREALSWRLTKIELLMIDIPTDEIIIKQRIDDISVKNQGFDFILTNPPFGHRDYRDNITVVKGEWGRRFSRSNRHEVAFICNAIDHLEDKGRAAVIVPAGLLSGAGINAEFREELVKKNILEAVILLPTGIFYNSGVSVAILFLKKSRKRNSVLLVNATGSGIKSNDRHILHEKDISRISSFLHYNEVSEKILSNDICITVTPEQIAQRKYDLLFFAYTSSNMPFPSGLAPSEEIWLKCVDLEEQLKQTSAKLLSFIKYKT